MKERTHFSDTISLSERVATAFVSAFAAAFTLALYPLAMLLLGTKAGGGGGFELGAIFYAFVFSKVGLAVVIGAAILGFCLGSERMASVFSFFWGTHTLWERLEAYLDDRTSALRTDYKVFFWYLAILFAILTFVIVYVYA